VAAGVVVDGSWLLKVGHPSHDLDPPVPSQYPSPGHVPPSHESSGAFRFWPVDGSGGGVLGIVDVLDVGVEDSVK
jgi:hypothetical protein